MAIIGTIVKVKDFLSHDLKKVTISDSNGEEAFTLSADRVYYIPAFQREIRWGKENLNVLLQDIKSANKFLGNVILSKRNEKDFDIIDGQQRISVLLMLLFYLKEQWGERVHEAKQFIPCSLKIDSFDAYEKLQANKYDVNALTDEEKSTDKYNQSERYGALWESLDTILGSKDRQYIRDLFTNLKRCTLNVILAERDNTGYNIEYFIDVNLKGVRLDVEDIFKGYLFHMDNSDETLANWVNIKQTVMRYNAVASEILKDDVDIYPLMKTLYHYYNCDIYSNKDYIGLKFGVDFYLKNDFSNVVCGSFYKGEHLIKVVNDDAYIKSSLIFLNKIITILNDIILTNEPSTEFIELFDTHNAKNGVDNDTIVTIKGLARLLLLNKDITLPYALLMKYFLNVIKSGNKIDREYANKFYNIYVFSVLFGLFSNKKELSEIEPILQSDDWYVTLSEKIKSYCVKGKILERKVLFQSKYLPENDDEINSHKCKSLAILYNYFNIVDGHAKIIKGKGKAIKKFLLDKDKFSVEHFIVNDSKCCTTDDCADTYHYADDIKKYTNSIFNFIYIPEEINGNILKNHYINYKIRLLEQHKNDIVCEYSKMVIGVVERVFFDLPLLENGKIDTDKADEYFGYMFKRHFAEISNTIIQKIIEHIS